MTSYTSYSELFTVIISCNFQYSWSDGLGSESATLAPTVLKVATDDDFEQLTVASIASHELLCFDTLSTSN